MISRRGFLGALAALPFVRRLVPKAESIPFHDGGHAVMGNWQDLLIGRWSGAVDLGYAGPTLADCEARGADERGPQ